MRMLRLLLLLTGCVLLVNPLARVRHTAVLTP
jgi:hypothetical protein